jgi:hypothetical protein
MTPASLSAWRNQLISTASALSSSATTLWSTHPQETAARLPALFKIVPTNAFAPASDVDSASKSLSTAALMMLIPPIALTMLLMKSSPMANVIK